jgi:RNA-directed DNA polymerase
MTIYSPSWFRPRGYLHFDAPITKECAVKIATDPNAVARHSFYPLVGYTIETIKARRDKLSGAVSKKPKKRLIRYASHVDSHIYSYYSFQLEKKYEETLAKRQLSACVLAFRALGKSNVDFAARAFDCIRQLGDCTALAFDVSGFFDNIDHKLLKRRWADTLGTTTLPPDDYAVFKSLTRYSFVDRDKVYAALGISPHNPKNGRRRICSADDFRALVRNAGLIEVHKLPCGIPQGTPISALLSNIYLLDFDVAMQLEASSRGGFYFRYCDDILLIVPGHDSDLEHIVNSHLDNLKLEAHAEKTEKSYFTRKGKRVACNRALQYLGFLYDGERVLLRSAALAKFSARMKKGVKLAKSTAISRNKERLNQGRPLKVLYRRQLYERYSYLGKRNFLSYGFDAAKVMNSAAIRRQLRPLWGRLKAEIEKQ